MANNDRVLLDRTFSALADPTRRAILDQLTKGEAPVGDLAAPFDMAAPSISRHLRVLEEAGLIARNKQGRIHLIRLVPEPMGDALEWIARTGNFWAGQLDSLEQLLEKPDTGGSS